MQEEDVAPSVNLLESMRSVGYSFEAALADLIDNSITAEATIVDVDADVINGEFVTVLDNGHGMSAGTAREALRLAGSTRQRGNDDLGRFGLGLKTASLSQGRSVTVATRHKGETTILRWDIDHVLETGRWALLKLDDSDAARLPSWSQFDNQDAGTLVVWQNLDLLLNDTYDRGEHLRDKIIDAHSELSLIFHRFLRGGRLQVRLNGAKLDPIDPFLESNSRTQISPVDEIRIGGDIVEVQAYTLPHASGLTPAERARNDLSTGMREAQGLYIYRNRRLIAHGGWYGLAARNELTKQTRIRVDIPNSLDGLWQLDIKKSRAEPPASFKRHLKRIIDPLLDRGKRVHTYRGRRAAESHLTRVWDKIIDRNGLTSYTVNLEHPLLVLLRSSLSQEQAALLDSAFELIAEGYPSHDLYAVMAASGVAAESAPQQESVISKLRLLQSAGALGLTSVEATAQLSSIEPFNRVENLHELIRTVMQETDLGAE